MCGIAGIIGGNASAYTAAVEAMVTALHHRGPDEFGQYAFDNAVLGHARLSIVDINSGQQPMVTADGRVAISFNGEIYGYQSVRKKLNYDYRTHSDTEVLLALYRTYGTEMMAHVPGMFAFAIWDEDRQQLFCARDRFGEKPFYYALGPSGELIFASEIKAILATGLVEPEVDLEAVAYYLHRAYVHPSNTIYSNIYTLPPGYQLLYKEGDLYVERYWRVPVTGPSIGLADAKEKLIDLMAVAVNKQLVADVDVGAFLSGGLDSSTVVASAVNQGSSLTTLSYRFDGELDEGEFAKMVANQYKTNHIELYDDNIDVPSLMLRMAEVYDEPFADSSSFPTYLICRKAREHLKVVLTGDGADELFGGYVGRYRPLFHRAAMGDKSALEQLATFLFYTLLRRTVAKQNEEVAYRAIGSKMALKQRTITQGVNDVYDVFTGDELAQYGLSLKLKKSDFDVEGGLNDAFKADALDYMAGDILVKVDRASMASSLELRAPFLDKDLAEYALSLPADLKIDGKNDKIILREAFSRDWPKPIQARSKQGFGAPTDRWLADPKVNDLKMSYLDKGRKICSLLAPELIDRYRESNCGKTWVLLNLSIWLEAVSA